MLAEQPELLEDIKKVISLYIENTVMGMAIPDISGDKDWGRYSLEGLAVAEVTLPRSGKSVCGRFTVQLTPRKTEQFETSLNEWKSPVVSDHLL